MPGLKTFSVQFLMDVSTANRDTANLIVDVMKCIKPVLEGWRGRLADRLPDILVDRRDSVLLLSARHVPKRINDQKKERVYHVIASSFDQKPRHCYRAVRNQRDYGSVV